MTEVLRFDRIGSTQTEANRRAAAGDPPGTTIVALRQEMGRGRADHRWFAPVGGLYLSRIEVDPGGPIELLPMAIAVGLATWLERVHRVRCRLRWPNDLWVSAPPGKIAGILAERVIGPHGPRLVVGIGVNVESDLAEFPEEIRSEVAVLRDRADGDVSLPATETAVLHALADALRRVGSSEGSAGIVHEAAGRLEGIGRSVTLDGVPVGRLVGLDATGALVTESGGARRTHLAGTLRFLP